MNIRERELAGEGISVSDPEDSRILGFIQETMQLAHALNHSPKLLCPENRALLAGILGRPLDDPVTIAPPFYIDYRKSGTTIDDSVFLAPEVNLITLNHHPDLHDRSTAKCAPVRTGSYVWIGMAATVLPGVTIGSNSTIGAHSVAPHNVPANVIAAGNPAAIARALTAEETARPEV